MTNNIHKHPGLLYADEIDQLCRPLQKLNISYFAHVRIDNEKKFSGICNNPKFLEVYLENEYYNADIHLAQDNQFGKYVIWDAIEPSGLSYKMDTDAANLGVKHAFTIIDKNANGNDFYHFANNSTSKSINQVYIENIDLLKLFITHFKENMQNSKKLITTYDLQFEIDPDTDGFQINANSETQFTYDKHEFLSSLSINKTNALPLIFPGLKATKMLSRREMECIHYYAKGKMAKDISQLIGLSRRTVEHYLESAKSKLGVSSKNDLIQSVIHNLEDKFG